MAKGNKLQDAYRIAKYFGPQEFDNLARFIPCFDTSATKHDSKTLRFTNIIREVDILPTAVALRMELFSDTSETNFYYLLRNSTKKMLEYATSDRHLDSMNEDGGQPSAVYKARAKVTKKILKAHAAAIAGCETTAVELLETGIAPAIEYELFHELEQIYRRLLVLARQNGRASYLDIRAKYTQTTEIVSILTEAFLIYNDYYNEVTHSGIKRGDLIAALEENLEWLQNNAADSKSGQILFYFHSLRTEYYGLIHQPFLAEAAQLELMDSLRSSKAMYVDWRLGEAFVNLASTQMQAYDFSAASNSLSQACELMTAGLNSYISALEYAAHTSFWLGDYDHALTCIEEAKAFLQEDDKKRFQKLEYLAAHISFAVMDYKSSAKSLVAARYLAISEPGGWSIGIRLLHLCIKLEKDLIAQADDELEAMRKHKERFEKKGGRLGLRDLTKYNVLRVLSGNSFDFKATKEACKYELAKLSEVGTDFAWFPDSHEKIPFHIWFECKAAGKPYRFELWEEAIKWQNSAPGSQLRTG